MSGILVIGSFVMDMVATVDEFPQVGQTIIGNDLKKYPGGKGANQCVTIARLGQEVNMIGKVGKDDNGDVFKQLFEKEGISAKDILTCNQHPTGLGLIQLDKHHDNKIVVIPGANHSLTIEELVKYEESIKAADYVLTQLELNLEVECEIIKMCHKHQVKLILNPAPAADLPLDILQKVYLITPNETELAYLTKMPTTTLEEIKEASKKLIEIGVQTVVCTMGSQGAMIVTRDVVEIVDAYKVDAVDTVAAGDSFNGALVTCLYRGLNLSDAVRYANATAALSVQKQGAIPSIPTKKDVDVFLSSR